MMVELWTRKRDWGNHHEKLGLKRISCASQFTIPDTVGATPDLAGRNTDMRSSKPNQETHTLNVSYPLVSLISCPSSPPSLFLVQNSTIIAEHKVNSSLSISPCHYYELTLSTAYTKYSPHRVQHKLSTAYTLDWLSSFHSHDYELTPECSFSFRRASVYNRPPPASSPCELKCKVTTLDSPGCKLTNR
jgi:hypothetical protein